MSFFESWSIGDFKPLRAFAIARKEVFHILRDPFTLTLAIGLPLFIVTFFGYAIDFTIRDINIAVYDNDHTQSSRRLIESFSSSDYFRTHDRERPAQLVEDLDGDRAKAGLVIDRDFERHIGEGKPVTAQLMIDGSDNSTIGILLGYFAVIQQSAGKLLTGTGALTPPVALTTTYLFNPRLESQWFIVPGLTVVVLAILSILLTALTVAREWENGSMELLLSTPVKPLEIIAGKLAPYLGLGLLAMVFVYLVARLGFGVPFAGSHFLFVLGSLIFIGCYLALGLFISVTVRAQRLSMQLSILAGLLPTMFLSGFVYSIEDMPPFFRAITALVPARWFMDICRGVFLRGSTFSELSKDFAILTLEFLFLVRVSTKAFKKDLEP